jgi:AcrR family transcriptional regulator
MPRETLTREQIIRAAIEILDAEGLDGLNMRRLGDRLGSAATAVYWHVKSRDELVILAGDEVWREIGLPDADEVGWRDAATTMAKDLYAMTGRHPWLVSAMGNYLVYGPNKARSDDHMLGVFEAAGFSPDEAGEAATTVATLVMGTALSRAADASWRARLRRNGHDEKLIEKKVAEVFGVAMQFPRLRAIIETHELEDIVKEPDRELEFGLRTVLDGLEAQLATRPKRRRRSPARR